MVSLLLYNLASCCCCCCCFFSFYFLFYFTLGNINASLMTLRTCMEVLRENQGNVENGISPKVKILILCKERKGKRHNSMKKIHANDMEKELETFREHSCYS